MVVRVTWQGDVKRACDSARQLAVTIGFPESHAEEIVLAVNELATNLIKHASGGSIQLSIVGREGRTGIQVEADDNGPGIKDINRAITDGYSTAGGLGIGLGSVNRVMDEMEIHSERSAGTHIVCQRWVRPTNQELLVSELEFGAATRAYRNADGKWRRVPDQAMGEARAGRRDRRARTWPIRAACRTRGASLS